MSTFDVLILTATPPGVANEGPTASVKIDGREALLRSVELFLNRDNVKQIQVVYLPGEIEEGKRKHGGHLGLFGVKVIAGGPRWVDQLVAGAEKVSSEVSHIIVHDASRPAVSQQDVDALIESAETAPAVALATPLKPQLVELDEGGNPIGYRSAKEFMQILTPQAYSKAKFAELVAAKREAHASELTLLKGSPYNVRINHAGDASLLRAMIGLLPKPKSKASNNPFEEAQW